MNDVELGGAYQFETSNSTKLRKVIDGTGNIERAGKMLERIKKKNQLNRVWAITNGSSTCCGLMKIV